MSATLPAKEFSIGIKILYSELSFANWKASSKVEQATTSALGKTSKHAKWEYAPF